MARTGKVIALLIISFVISASYISNVQAAEKNNEGKVEFFDEQKGTDLTLENKIEKESPKKEKPITTPSNKTEIPEQKPVELTLDRKSEINQKDNYLSIDNKQDTNEEKSTLNPLVDESKYEDSTSVTKWVKENWDVDLENTIIIGSVIRMGKRLIEIVVSM